MRRQHYRPELSLFEKKITLFTTTNISRESLLTYWTFYTMIAPLLLYPFTGTARSTRRWRFRWRAPERRTRRSSTPRRSSASATWNDRRTGACEQNGRGDCRRKTRLISPRCRPPIPERRWWRWPKETGDREARRRTSDGRDIRGRRTRCPAPDPRLRIYIRKTCRPATEKNK